MSTLKTGDVVQLKSGGPEMTVSEIVGHSATCIWFEELCNPFGGKLWGELRTRTVQQSDVLIVR